ncbi:hypothetical protein BH10ACI2_BH10ACI2_08810 [soil metagenome]
MYYFLGISLLLAFLLIVNMIVAALAAAFWRAISGHLEDHSVNTKAQIIFGLRILPLAAALIFVFAFIGPSYLLLEPAGSGEVVSGKLGLLALISSIGVLVALYRVFGTWLATRRLIANWMENAVQIDVANINVPVYRIGHQFPVIAVIGILRPKLFIAEQVIESLDTNEFAAAIAHEYGHLQANDNFKRTLLRVCRDLLILPFGKDLDRAWAENAESVADEFAAKTGRSTALDLASALVKIARIAPLNARPAMPSGAFLLEEQNVDVTSRVRRLIRLSESKTHAAKAGLPGFSPASLIWSAALTTLMILPLVDRRFLETTHDAIERFVRILQ